MTGPDENRSSPTVFTVGVCLFLSGFCSLIYQTVWLREFRLIFGASTAASSAVLAIFMGGLGTGSIVLGSKVEASRNAFRLYARLELAVAIGAAFTPGFLWLACRCYLLIGGTLALGQTLGTIVRLAFAAAVLLVPTFLMGGTLPAAVKAIQSEDDLRRRQIALLYGANTLGAVAGTLLSTFFLFEHTGHRFALWSACGLNLLVAAAATQISARLASPRASGVERAIGRANVQDPELSSIAKTKTLVLAAAGVAGFAFFLMEMVWYRMLGPLLGGSTFSFGLILAVALAGIGAGSLAYAFLGGGRPATVAGFAIICSLEAFFIAWPYALGDRLAVLAILLQPFGGLGFSARVGCWGIIAGAVVLPASFFAGVQFPMLISLLGRGRRGAGADTALAYGWNTAGAIAGSLAGGFGLLPALGALGVWRLVVLVLLALAATSALVAARGHRRWLRLAPTILAGTAAALFIFAATGPTAAWRHTPIGAGRVTVKETKRSSLNAFADFIQTRRRNLVWEAEGIESSIGLLKEDGYSFIVNGKSDGSARGDAPTQVMLGLLGTLVHAAPREALVIGLGTGSTAGWLAAVPALDRVDVVELEPAMCKVAEDCAPVNHQALSNPKLHLWFGDGREAMLTSRRHYDVIASEPSNPYRAGVASLFTREFYQAAIQRLRPGGLFVQWVQAYEVDGESIRTVYATLCSVFPVVETWKTQSGDLAFLASREPIIYNVTQMRERVAQEPYRSALARVWRVTDLEGVFGRYIAHRKFADLLAQSDARPATDDCNGLEFGFARTLGAEDGFDTDKLSQLAKESHCDRPEIINGSLDWEKVYDRRVSALVLEGRSNFESNAGENGFRARTQAKAAFAKGDFIEALSAWRSQSSEPTDLLELLMLAQCLAITADDTAPRCIGQLRQWFPCEADALAGEFLWRTRRPGEAFVLLNQSLRNLRVDPWPRARVMVSALERAETICRQNPGQPFAAQLCATLSEPFTLGLLDLDRMVARLEMAELHDPLHRTSLTQQALAEFEPNVPWTAQFLRLRLENYARQRDKRALQAVADWERFTSREAKPFGIGSSQPSGLAGKSGVGVISINARER